MTAIHFYRSPNGGLEGFSVIGHTGSKPAGEDIICAAVSALSLAAVNALEAVAEIDVAPIVRDGVLHVRIRGALSARQRHDARVILRTAWLGLHDIAAEYPRYVRIS